MKYLFFYILLTFSIVSYSQTNDNSELKQMYNDDQNSRQVEQIDWKFLTKEDSIRRNRVHEMLESNQIVTGKDFYRAAMIYQHGKDSNDYRMAIKLIKTALKLDTTISPWLLAATIDRELMSRKEPQIYGTQYFIGSDGVWKLYKIDSLMVNDNERKKYKVPSLSETREKIRQMNLKEIENFYHNSKSLELTINLIKQEYKKGNQSAYNVSEHSINSLGYQVLHSGDLKRALKLFKLNTKLYPLASNTYDSLGECLLLLNKTKQGIKAYKKSLSLNPQNENAKKIINKN
ncbi:MAG: tetratricopeptide repeat protein [Flavobacteriales bacterium]|nr:tetratricopeptide repeat protein [Flavobacteriales bacterium]